MRTRERRTGQKRRRPWWRATKRTFSPGRRSESFMRGGQSRARVPPEERSGEARCGGTRLPPRMRPCGRRLGKEGERRGGSGGGRGGRPEATAGGRGGVDDGLLS